MSEVAESWMERMEGKVDALRIDMASLKAVREQVGEHHESLYGNGKPGLVLDVDRLKQSHRIFKWAIGIMIASATTAAIDLIRVIWH